MYKLGMRNIYQLGGLRWKMPLTMVAFTIASLSMVGIPPTAGFFSKLYLILGAIQAKQWIFIAVILISSLLNAVYFFKVIEIAFFKPDGGKTDEGGGWEGKIETDEMPRSMLIPDAGHRCGDHPPGGVQRNHHLFRPRTGHSQGVLEKMENEGKSVQRKRE